MNYLDIMKKRHEAFMRWLRIRHEKRMWEICKEYQEVKKLEVKCKCHVH